MRNIGGCAHGRNLSQSGKHRALPGHNLRNIATISLNKQCRGSQMPRGWFKHAKDLLKCAQGAKKAPRKMVNKQQAGKIPKST